MEFPQTKSKVKHYKDQSLQMRGINLTDNYADMQMESCKGIGISRFPYISTSDKLTAIDAGVPSGYNAVSIFPWDKLFVVTNKPSANGGYECYYGGTYCGDAASLELPKQYAVVNSKLVMWPDKVMFNINEESVTSQNMNTAAEIATVTSGTIEYRKAVTS